MTVNENRAAQLRAYLSVDPSNVPLACDAVDACFEQGLYADAVSLLAQLPADTQRAPGVRFRAARCALVMGSYADAAAILQGLIAEGHGSDALWHDLAFSQLCLRDTHAARATLATARERFPMTPELAIVAARVAMMDGEFAEAHAMLDAALALEPGNATAHGVRALAYLDEGHTDEADAAALRCLAESPDQHEALLVAGTAALWQRRTDAAESHFDRALSRHPNSGRALSGMGQVEMLRGALDAARARLERAVVAMPDHIGTWHALAWTQLLGGDVDGAAASYDRAYALDRNFADSHGGLALVQALRGEADAADASIRRALRLNPACATALYARSLLLSDAGRVQESEAVLESLVAGDLLPEGVDVREFAARLRARIQPGVRG